MATVPLPQDPHVDQLRRQARELQRAVRAGDPDALAHVVQHVPDATIDPATLTLSTAQLVIARHHGFASWPRLREHLAVVDQYARRPAAADAPTDAADQVDAFLRAACLTYEGDDGPARWAVARRLLEEHPHLPATSIHAAAAACSVTDLERFLASDPAAARAEGGPFRWEPLLYLAYARHDADVTEAAVVDSAQRLLDAGADANAGYLWHGLPTPFTALTGAFGAGEQGIGACPPHPQGDALARVLLEAGADPNDGQALYNRMFDVDDSHLELLFAFGLGTGDGGPWKARLGDALDDPATMLRGQLRWAVTHHQLARVRLLAAHGVDLRSPFADGRTPAELAALTAAPDVVALLVAHGAGAPSLDPVDALVAAVLVADAAEVDRLVAEDPVTLDEARRRHPALVLRAAVHGHPDAVRLAAARGFDVNARGRADAPVDQPWETALHHVAHAGDRTLAELLLSLGADPGVLDQRFGATPLGWARHGGQAELIALLEPVTPEA